MIATSLNLLACAGCLDSQIACRHPLSGYLIVVLAAWVFAIWKLRKIWCQRMPADVVGRDLPGGRVFVIGFWCGFVVFVYLTMLTAPHAGLFVVTVGSAIVMTLLSVEAVVRRKRFPWYRGFVSVNAVVAVVLLGLWVSSETIASGLKHQVSCVGKLAYNDFNAQWIPRVIARGEPAVPELLSALEREIRSDHAYHWRLGCLAYCLRSIGGETAKNGLTQIVRNIEPNRDQYRAQGIAAVCCAFVDCAGENAEPTLIEAHAKFPKDQKLSRWAIQCGLLRIGSPSADEFVNRQGAGDLPEVGMPDVQSRLRSVQHAQRRRVDVYRQLKIGVDHLDVEFLP